MMTDQAPTAPTALEPAVEVEDVDLFVDAMEERLNAGSSSTLGSTSSFSCVGTYCSFGTVGSACTS